MGIEGGGGDVPSYSLQQFIQDTAERDRPGDVFELESRAMLEIHVNGRTWAKLGSIAMTTHGDPLALRVSPKDPVTTDPNATVAWSANLEPQIKTDISFRTLLGRGGGEAFQMQFIGQGFVPVQPFDEVALATGRVVH